MCKLSAVRMSMWSSFHRLGARTGNSRDVDECLALSEGATSLLAEAEQSEGAGVERLTMSWM